MGSILTKIGKILKGCFCCSSCHCSSECCGNRGSIDYENNQPDRDSEYNCFNGCCYVHRIHTNHDKKDV